MKKYLMGIVLLVSTNSLIAQGQDSLKLINLFEIDILTPKRISEIERLPDVQGTIIYAGKKNEVIRLDKLDADLSTNNTRQVFAKVPGLSIWENDGSGIQVGIATRGLSPNRSWEFNVRQNGYDISSEVFGYPESYFSPPMEALEKIELVRGAASLQFGPQFGGLLNYEIKKAPKDKAFSFETQQTKGSYGLYNAYNAVGGTYKKISYYAYFHHRSADGWRNNSRYAINTGYASLTYDITSKLKLAFQYTRMDYQSQQPGGLTDQQFSQNARQSSRARNWMSTPWNVGAVILDYKMNANANWNLKLFTTNAERNSVGYTRGINLADSFNISMNSYTPRQVDKDQYVNYGAELRFLQSYPLLNQKSALALGVRAYKGATWRRQLGTGTTGNGFDLSLSKPGYGRELKFETENYALFAENNFKLGHRLTITPGLRCELVNSDARGFINTTASGTIQPATQKRTIILGGIGAGFKTSIETNLYANFSQCYRPVTYSELTPAATTDIIDPNLKDASGYNADFGFRGALKNFLQFDVGAFYLYYNNRIGTILQDKVAYRTNIGASISKGIETFVELDLFKLLNRHSTMAQLRVFSSYAFVDARYTRWNNPALAGDPAKAIEGKRVENAPQQIGRYGITYRFKALSITAQLSQVSESFTDAVNTEKANAAGTVGKIEAYQVLDLSTTYLLLSKYTLKAGLNNLTDEVYATRRAGGYPGPGLLPANGRTFFVSLGARF